MKTTMQTLIEILAFVIVGAMFYVTYHHAPHAFEFRWQGFGKIIPNTLMDLLMLFAASFIGPIISIVSALDIVLGLKNPDPNNIEMIKIMAMVATAMMLLTWQSFVSLAEGHLFRSLLFYFSAGFLCRLPFVWTNTSPGFLDPIGSFVFMVFAPLMPFIITIVLVYMVIIHVVGAILAPFFGKSAA